MVEFPLDSEKFHAVQPPTGKNPDDITSPFMLDN